MLIALLLSPALAGEASFQECLSAAGETPRPATLSVIADGSQIQEDLFSWNVEGLWEMSCDGRGSFDPAATLELDPEPAPLMGQVVMTELPKAALRCFAQTCDLPEGVCTGHSDGTPLLELCGGGEPSADDLTGTFIPGLAATPAPVSAPDPFAAPPAAAPAATKTAQRASASDVDLTVPPPPGDTCEVSALLRKEAKRRVLHGNEAELEGDWNAAANEYRAAISMNPCSPFAWADLGALALELGRPDRAVQALAVAERFFPGHYAAVTALGRSYEALGQRELAVENYRKVLAQRAGHRPAQEGLARLGASY